MAGVCGRAMFAVAPRRLARYERRSVGRTRLKWHPRTKRRGSLPCFRLPAPVGSVRAEGAEGLEAGRRGGSGERAVRGAISGA